MQTVNIGSFRIAFTSDGVEFRTLHQTDTTTLSYSESYELFRILYLQREKLYKESQREEVIEPYVLNEQQPTYIVNDESLATGSWEA